MEQIVITPKSLEHAAADAVGCQDACNLSGVVRSLAAAMPAIWAEARKQELGTDWVNNHPIVRLFVDKLASLCGMQGDATFGNFRPAYEECLLLATGGATDGVHPAQL